MLKNLNYKSAICFIFFNMMVIGFTESMKGLFVSQFKNTFNVTDSAIGIMFSVAILGYILSTYLGGIMCSRLGQKKVFILSIILIALSYFSISIAPNFIFFLFAIFVSNIASGLQAISVNSVSPLLFIAYQTILINLTHFFYGFGVTISQRFSGLMISKGFTFRTLYLWNGIIFLFFLLWIFVVEFPNVKTEKMNMNILEAFKNKLVILFIFAGGFYVFSEIGFLNWFINFAQDSYKFSTYKASFYSSLFFLIFTIGRLVGGFVVQKLGIKKSIIVYLSFAVVFFSIGYILQSRFTIFISISGFFFSIIFPTTVTMIGYIFKENTAYIMGVIFTFAFTINMLFNSLLGFLNDILSSYMAFSLIPISLTLSLIFYLLIFKNIKKTTLL